MDIAINAVSRVIGTYQSQAKIAELFKENAIKVVQGQEDRVTISSKAKELMLAQKKEAEIPKASSAPTATPRHERQPQNLEGEF